MIFRQEHSFNDFQEYGYVKLPFLDKDVINELRDFYFQTEHQADVNSQFYTSIWSKNKKYREDVNNFIIKKLQPYLDKVFLDYSIAFANYMIKRPGNSSALHPHQDWTFVEEPKYYSITVWIPLQDVDDINGALDVLPNSNEMDNYVRARFQDAPFRSDIEAIKHKMVNIPLKEGEALLVNSRTIHSSPNNNSNLTRVSASVVVYPKEAELKHYLFNEKTSSITEKIIDTSFYTKYSCFEIPEIFMD